MRKKIVFIIFLALSALYAEAQVTGSGTTNTVPKWTGTTAIGDSAITEVSGTVGIGTTTPALITKLHVFSSATLDSPIGLGPDPNNGPALNIGYSGASFGRGSGFLNVRPDALAVAPNPSLRFMTANVTRMVITNTGAIGIGTWFFPASGYLLDVNGGGHFSGSLVVDGNLAAKYQDVAEWVSSEEQLSAGTVVIVAPGKTDQVVASPQAYDTRVAGVVSTQPGLILGVPGESKLKVATTGRVRVRVDATAGPIEAGDILVTSAKPGVAMKSTPVDVSGVKFHRPGTVVGKALEALPSGEAEILVLLSLQ